jgi:hypothetical protein
MIDELKSICNYSDKQMSHHTAQLMYIDMVSQDEEEYQRKLKQRNRELVVDAILDDKIEELNIFRENNTSSVAADLSSQYNSTVSSSGNQVISPKIMKLNLTSKKFETYQKLKDEVIDFLNQNTKLPKSIAYGPMSSLDVKLTGDFDQDFRRIITKIQMCSSIISMEGRIGPATSIIYGKKSLPYINQNQFNGIQTYFSELIDDDKIIVCRGNNQNQPGLILIDNSTTGSYFFNHTQNWHKQYCWFNII